MAFFDFARANTTVDHCTGSQHELTARCASFITRSSATVLDAPPSAATFRNALIYTQ